MKTPDTFAVSAITQLTSSLCAYFLPPSLTKSNTETRNTELQRKVVAAYKSLVSGFLIFIQRALLLVNKHFSMYLDLYVHIGIRIGTFKATIAAMLKMFETF